MGESEKKDTDQNLIFSRNEKLIHPNRINFTTTKTVKIIGVSLPIQSKLTKRLGISICNTKYHI